MGWGKALIIGFCIYVGVYIINFVIFVGLGLGYTFSNLANRIAEILAFPLGTGKNYNLFLSALFWTIIIAVLIKSIGFMLKNNLFRT